MKIEEKDLKNLVNLTKLIKNNIQFDLNATEVVECYHAFAWLEGLKARMDESINNSQPQQASPMETMKDLVQGEIKPLPKKSKSRKK